MAWYSIINMLLASLKTIMKNMLAKLLIVGIIWCAGGSSQPKAVKNYSTVEIAASDSRLNFNNGILAYNAQPFSGVFVERYPDGRAKSKTVYRQGKKHGADWLWYPTGELYWKRNYQNGEKHGVHPGWWPHGQSKFLYHFVNGHDEGDAQEWYKNEHLAKSQHFALGVEVGEQQAWRENGKLYVNYVIKKWKTLWIV